MLDVAADITTSGVLDCVASGTVASAEGVMPMPASTFTLSLTTNSCARRRVMSGRLVSSLTSNCTFRPATVSPFFAVLRNIELGGGHDLAPRRDLLARHRQDQSDLERLVLREYRQRCHPGSQGDGQGNAPGTRKAAFLHRCLRSKNHCAQKNAGRSLARAG